MHHVLAGGLAALSLVLPAGAGLHALNTTLLEFGSLWLNFAVIFPGAHTRWARALFYTATRLASVAVTADLLRILPAAGATQGAAVVLVLFAGLYYDNLRTGVKLWSSALRDDAKSR